MATITSSELLLPARPAGSFLSTRRGKLTLSLLCAAAFLDFVDASIVNVALPSIRHALGFSVQGLVWVPGAYLLTYGGFMLLGGRAADILGRRRILVLRGAVLVTGGTLLLVYALSQARVGTRAVIVTGALIAAGGLYWLSRIPVHGIYLADLLPGMLVLAVGFGALFVGVATAANAGVPADKAGLAPAMLNSSQQLVGVLGLAVLTALATSRTTHLFADHATAPHALTAGFQRGLLAGSLFILVAAVIALRATNTRGKTDQPTSADTVTRADSSQLTIAGPVTS